MELMSWVWIGLIVLFIIVEAVTTELVAIWFVGGAVAAFIATLCGLELWVQVLTFVVISGTVLLAARPAIMKKVKTAVVPTNADMLIGQVGVVIKDINNDRGEGRVEISGLDWAAVSSSDETIKQDTRVTVQAIQGVKLIVTPTIKEK